jgi:hypothetical protein
MHGSSLVQLGNAAALEPANADRWFSLGLARAQRFSWARMAESVASVLSEVE